MRNLAQYPLTAEEARDTLAHHVKAAVDKQSFGSLEAHALARIAQFLDQHDTEFRAFLSKPAR